MEDVSRYDRVSDLKYRGRGEMNHVPSHERGNHMHNNTGASKDGKKWKLW